MALDKVLITALSMWLTTQLIGPQFPKKRKFSKKIF